MMKRHDKTLLSFWSAKKVYSNDDTVSDEDENLFETESESDNRWGNYVRDGNESVAVIIEFLAFQQHYNFIKSRDAGL